MENGEKLFDTFGEYLDKCGDVEFDFSAMTCIVTIP